MVNVNKLRGRIVENGMTIENLSSMIGMNKSTFYRKLNEKGDTFTIKEANAIVNCLNLSSDEATNIFFAAPVACGATE